MLEEKNKLNKEYRYLICKYFFPFCGLPFHPVDSHNNHKIFNCDEIQPIVFVSCTFSVMSMKSLTNKCPKAFSHFILRVL